jgi:glycosyltransferase involved in cell wall biosynthesis
VESWTAALKRLHYDAGLRQRLGANARATLEQNFTREKRARDLIVLVREKLGMPTLA